MAKFTFKNYPEPKGLSRIASGEPGADVKLKGKIVGFISPASRHRHYCVAFFKVKREKTYEEPCPFENKPISFTCKEVSEMKEYLKENTDEILKGLELYISEV